MASLIAWRSNRETLGAAREREAELQRQLVAQREEDRADRSLERAHALDLATRARAAEHRVEQLGRLRDVHSMALEALSVAYDAGLSERYDLPSIAAARTLIREARTSVDLDAGEPPRAAFARAVNAMERLWWKVERAATDDKPEQKTINEKELRDARLLAADEVEKYREAAREDLGRLA